MMKYIKPLLDFKYWVLFLVSYIAIRTVEHKAGITKVIERGQAQIDGEESIWSKLF